LGQGQANLDGDSQVLASTDALVLARIAAGFRGDAVTNGAMGIGAQRGRERIQEILARDCGMSVVPQPKRDKPWRHIRIDQK
jgi:hypothetical protein